MALYGRKVLNLSH